MPHAIYDYSTNIIDVVKEADIAALVHKTMINSGLFEPSAIKTRGHATSDFIVGEKGKTGSFLHLRVYMLEGRTAQQKTALADDLFNILKTPLQNVDSVTIDIRDMDKTSYRKQIAQ